MKPPNLRRLSLEDFPDAPNWMGKLIFVLNQFMEQTVLLFNQNLTLGENIQARIFDTQFSTGANYSTGTFDPIRFSWTGSTLPQIVQIARINDVTGALILDPVGVPQWTYNNGNIVITYISGLTNNGKYSVRFIVQ